MHPLERGRPPCLLRRPVGTWPLPGFARLSQTRDELSALCVREPAILPPPGSPLLADVRERVELVFTELAGNALHHGLQPARVRLASTAQSWLISVQDSSPDQEPQAADLDGIDALDVVSALTSDTDVTPGLGLALAEVVSSHTGWYPHDGGKTVWADVPDTPSQDLLNRLQAPAPSIPPALPSTADQTSAPPAVASVLPPPGIALVPAPSD